MFKIHKVKFNIIATFLCMVVFIAILLNGGVGSAYAATTRYSDVLNDLRKDSAFNVDDYPDVGDDYSLKVIQVAESSDDELFVYVYHPAAPAIELTATSINMSLDKPTDNTQLIESTKLYNLTLLNSAGVFQKYRVDGLTVSSEETRYYNITSIYRKWIQGDQEPDNDNETRETAFEVGKLFVVDSIDGNVNYSAYVQDVVTITDKWNSYILYEDGYFLTHESKTASFFVAFDCNYNIENLLEADLTYTTRSFSQVNRNGWFYDPVYGEVSEPQNLTLHYDDYGTNVNKVWLFGEKTTWKRIQSKSEFMSSDGDRLTDYAKQQLLNKKWVLRFLDTRYNQTHSVNTVGDYYSNVSYTEVNDVAILRLKFETQGTTYNLGVVDNKQTVSKDPANAQESWWDLFLKWLANKTGIPVWLWKVIFALLPFIILLPILSIIFPPFGQVLGIVFGWILKAVWWVISRPFVWIASLIRKRKEAALAKAEPSKSRKKRTPKTRTTSHTKKRKKKA